MNFKKGRYAKVLLEDFEDFVEDELQFAAAKQLDSTKCFVEFKRRRIISKLLKTDRFIELEKALELTSQGYLPKILGTRGYETEVLVSFKGTKMYLPTNYVVVGTKEHIKKKVTK